MIFGPPRSSPADLIRAQAAYRRAMGDCWQTRLPCPRKAEADGEGAPKPALPESADDSADDIMREHFDPEDQGFVPERKET